MAITVRVTNRFGFSLGHGDQMTFDPTSESHDALMEGSKFVFLRGMQCHGAVMDAAKFEVELGSDARLWVDFCAGGFEPQATGESRPSRNLSDPANSGRTRKAAMERLN